MKEISDELGNRAAHGEQATLGEIRSLLLAKYSAAKNEAKKLLLAIYGEKKISKEFHLQLLNMSRSCLELGRYDLSEAFRLLAFRDLNQSFEREDWFVEVRSDRKRRFTMVRLDAQLRIPSISSYHTSGYLPFGFHLDKDVSYLLSVESGQNELRISIPLYIPFGEDGPESINIDLNPWKGLGQTFILVPRVSCRIGGDIAARYSLPNQSIKIGPIVVRQVHVRMGEYLEALKKYNEAKTDSIYYPSCMG